MTKIESPKDRLAASIPQEALASGASDHQALAYGIAVGGVEAATEKMFDGVAGVFGKGAADDVVEGIAKRLAKNERAQHGYQSD